MRRVVSTGQDARERLSRGVDMLANPVKATLGPAGQNFIIEKGLRITNDGISVAKEIQSTDEIEDLGIRVIREACVKTNDRAGDGTTTAITLAQAMYTKFVAQMPKFTASGMIAGKRSAISLIKGVKQETSEVLATLIASAKPVTTEQEMVEVATVSVEFPELAEMIGKMQWQLGPSGYILAEESAEETDSIETIKGIRIDNGFGTSLVINNQEKQSLEVDETYVILTNYTLQNLKPLENIIGQIINACNQKKQKVQLVIVARAFTEDAVKICLENHKANVFMYPVNAPYVDQVEVMKDMAAVLGGTFINSEERELEDMTLSDVGFATKVTAYRYNAIFTGNGQGIDKRVAQLEQELKGEVSDFSKKALKDRIAQLKNGFALLKVGGTSERERKHRYDKAVDGCNAVKSALEEGTVKGGGLALYEIAETLPDSSLLKEPLKAPYNQIQANAGEPIEIEPWVRDSVKSVRVGLEQAASVASQLATTYGAQAAEFQKPLDQLLRGKVTTDE